jgi:putative adhesin
VGTWDRDEVKIHATSRGHLRLESSSARVSLVEDPYHGDYDDDDDHMGYEVTLPRSARLLTRSVSGDIRLHDMADVESHTVSGEIEVANIANRAIVETVSGDVTAQKIGAGLRANSVSGDIHATAITGEVAAQSVSGDIVLDDVTSAFVRTETVSGEIHFSGPVDAKGRYEFHSHSGDIDLGFASGGNDATLSVETYSGDLDSACQMTLQPGGTGSRMGKRGTFTLGNGNGAHFSIQTFSGDVHITGCRSHGEK